MYRRIVTFLFPLLLVGAERVARIVVTNEEAKRFIAPTVTALALGLLFPLLAPKNLAKQLFSKSAKVNTAGLVIFNRADALVSNVASVMVYVFTFVWIYFLYLSIRSGADEDPALLGRSTSIYSLVIYFVSAVLVEIKEWI